MYSLKVQATAAQINEAFRINATALYAILDKNGVDGFNVSDKDMVYAVSNRKALVCQMFSLGYSEQECRAINTITKGYAVNKLIEAINVYKAAAAKIEVHVVDQSAVRIAELEAKLAASEAGRLEAVSKLRKADTRISELEVKVEGILAVLGKVRTVNLNGVITKVVEIVKQSV